MNDQRLSPEKGRAACVVCAKAPALPAEPLADAPALDWCDAASLGKPCADPKDIGLGERGESPALTQDEGPVARDVAQAMAEHARDVILLLREDGTIVFGNAAALDAYGATREELLGTNIRELRAPSTRGLVTRQMEATAGTGTLFVTTHVRADGTEFPVEVSSRLVELDGSRYVLSIVRDITARVTREGERDALLADLEASNRQLEGLLRIVSSAVGRIDVDRLFAEVLSALREVMDADFSLLFVREGSALVLRAKDGLDSEAFQGFTMGVDEGFAGSVLDAGKPLWTRDVQATPSAMDVHDRYSLAAMFGIPLVLDGEPYGVLECAWCDERLVSQAERVMLQVAADRITSALAGAQRYERTRKAQVLDAAQSDATARLAASHALELTVPGALGIAAEALNCDVVAFGSNRDDTWDVLYAVGMDPGAVPMPSVCMSDADPDAALPVVHIGATSASSSWLKEGLGLQEALVVPVQVRSEWFGAIVFGRKRAAGGFDELESGFARRLSAAVSLAHANAWEYDAEHRISETLQEALLTLDGPVPGVEFGHLYRSATLATRVGGDFYDLFALPDGRAAVLVGDVSGKGLDAAVLTTVVKHTIRAFAHLDPSPASVVARTNSVLSAAARLPDFASVLFLVVDRATGQVSYCCAGHPPAMLRRGDGAIELCECRSPVIGAFADMSFVEDSFDLAPSDLVLLYTDGVTEARAANGEFFGEERLREALASHAGADTSELPAHINRSVMEFTSGRLTDDIAMVAFRLE